MIWPYVWYGLMLVAPFCLIVALSLSAYSVHPPYEPLVKWVAGEAVQITLHISNYLLVLKDSFYRAAFMNSMALALISTVVCLIISFPMAYGIARSPRRSMWLLLASVPFFTSFLVRIYAWMNLLRPSGLINQWLGSLGLGPFSLMHNPYAIIIGMVYSYLPFMIFPLYASLEKMPPQLLEAAYDLGCRPVSAFWRITVPLARSGILAGSSMVFIPAMGEYLIPELLGGPTALTIGRLLWFEFFVNRDWPLSATLAILVMVALWLPMWLGKRIVGFFQQRFGP
jgi:putrescine transport system permease protein